jgi:hypothetical protein
LPGRGGHPRTYAVRGRTILYDDVKYILDYVI